MPQHSINFVAALSAIAQDDRKAFSAIHFVENDRERRILRSVTRENFQAASMTFVERPDGRQYGQLETLALMYQHAQLNMEVRPLPSVADARPVKAGK